MDISYVLTPFVAWLCAGSLKYAINRFLHGSAARSLIGYGGMPSNHSAIVSSMAMLIYLREGLASPALGVAVTLAFIVMLDATSLRRHVGNIAVRVNELGVDQPARARLRERIGHRPIEILGGIMTGCVVACLVRYSFMHLAGQ
ncbi:divergent PAP2 family protein [Silvimonas iriomotensis]|uniref:Divergent PAP2 family protein n=1 Tax=Silvimonas iriomotensis TaxID=449662 RepID=A0ABQ2PEF5_9NEIS|nr:divergent PAP2 family protein [Silvimonas iriomotensis]GGP23641.1 hypothetical protein GCM10010970_36410 [Silvimonas iriomotensis]